MENEISFTAQTKPVGKGDVDADGEYTAADLAVLSRHMLDQFLLIGEKLQAADLNGDETVNILDLVRLKKILSNKVYGINADN